MERQHFVDKYGDPARFSFRSQCYDAVKPTTVCVCRRRIRFCFIVYTPTDQKLTLGSCCFHLFAGTRLAPVLEASQLLLLNGVYEGMKASKKAEAEHLLKESRSAWVKARREAVQRIRGYKRVTGKAWLPEALYDLDVATRAREPQHNRITSAVTWFQAKTEYLLKKLAEAEPVVVLLPHEEVVKHQG